MCTALALLVAVTTQINSLISFTRPAPKYLVTVSGVLTAVVNITISVTMAHILRSSKTGIARTDRALVKLYTYFHATGILTSAGSLIGPVLFISIPNNLAFQAMDFSVSQLYTISLLILLNSRDTLRQEMEKSLSFQVSLSAVSGAPQQDQPHPKVVQSPMSSIRFFEQNGSTQTTHSQLSSRQFGKGTTHEAGEFKAAVTV